MKTKLSVMMILGMMAVGCGDETPEPTDASQVGQLTAGPADSLRSGSAAAATDSHSTDDSSEPAAAADTAPSDSATRPAEPASDADVADTLSADCSADECGPGLGAPNFYCDDGSMGGPVCERDEAGICGWSIRQCPKEECQPDECGAPIRPPIVDCVDGTQGGPVCERDDSGVCGWTVRQCPAECDPRKCGDQPDWLVGCEGEDLHPVCLYDETGAADVASCSWQLPACSADEASR